MKRSAFQRFQKYDFFKYAHARYSVALLTQLNIFCTTKNKY